jgi:hypothetical protein
MFKVKQDTKVYFNGQNQLVPEGKLLLKGHGLLNVLSSDSIEAVKETKPTVEPASKKREPKEELLIEEPVAALEVEEVEEVEEIKKKPKRRKKSNV